MIPLQTNSVKNCLKLSLIGSAIVDWSTKTKVFWDHLSEAHNKMNTEEKPMECVIYEMNLLNLSRHYVPCHCPAMPHRSAPTFWF